MFSIHDHSDNDLMAFTVQGKVTSDDYDKLKRLLEQPHPQPRPSRFYVEIKGIEGIEPSAIPEDLKFYFRHLKNARKIAVVAHGSIWKNMVKAAGPFVEGEIQFFEESSSEEALEWVRE
jgi:hypothetical protein